MRKRGREEKSCSHETLDCVPSLVGPHYTSPDNESRVQRLKSVCDQTL